MPSALRVVLVSVFPGASRPRPRASRAKGCLKKLRLFIKTFCFKTFLLASLDGRGDRVSQRCLRGARFARNFFEKSFESLPRMIKSSTRLGVGQFFFRNSGAGGCGRALQMFRVCVFPGASRPKMLQEFFQKFGNIRENAPDPTFSGRARGGLTYFGASMIYCFA